MFFKKKKKKEILKLQANGSGWALEMVPIASGYIALSRTSAHVNAST